MHDIREDFAKALQELLKSKTLEHITVKDIAESCNVSRQTFYYHFSDIYALVEWFFIQEASAALASNHDINTWQEGYRNVLKRLQDNKDLVTSVDRSAHREYLEDFIYKSLYNVIYRVVEEEAADMEVAASHKEFIARFYSLATLAMGLDWIKKGMKESPDEIADQVATLVRGDFKKALRKYETSRPANA